MERMASIPFKMPSDPMTVASSTRVTKTGRTIRYDLTVIQQPERARACGSGAKSSADRRPVDPPPVVELRIFEKMAEKWDEITFAYGANFFLYATLEVARPMARGRVQPPVPPQVPVLTGMPVSGMAYLDRPQEAGYFIFPDLSVRHEGVYVLSFNLYEETRPDSEIDEKESKPMAAVMFPDSFDWRLEVKSELFTVYSAKKFPGLSESTVLSRTVAEQGCRVRIRRDVRMRRRDEKSSGEMDVQAEGYRPHRPVEQASYQARARSNSRSTDGRPEHQAGLPSRSDSSMHSNSEHSTGAHSRFANEKAAPSSKFSASSFPGPPPKGQGQQYEPHPLPYQQQGLPYGQYGQPQAQPPAVHPGYGDRSYAHSAVERNERDVYETSDPRRASTANCQPTYHAQQHSPALAVDQSYNRQPLRPYTSNSTKPSLPPLRQEPRDNMALSRPLTPLNVAALRSPKNERHDRPVPFQHLGSQLAPAPAPLTPAIPAEPLRIGMKRAHDSVFNSSATDQPLHNGMRPGSSRGDRPLVDEDDDDQQPSSEMVYRRASGIHYQRCPPNLS